MKFNLSKINFRKIDLAKGMILPEKITLDLAEEIGLHVGDGSMNFYSNKGIFQLRGHIEDDKEHYLNRIKKLYKSLYNLDINIREMKSTGVIGFQVWSDALVDFKSKIIGLPLGWKNNITIPKIINNKELFFAFMRGLFDTDGCLYIENKRGKPYPRIEIGTASENLCLQIVDLSKKYGLRSSYYKYERKEANWKTLHKVAFNGFYNLDKWKELIGSNNPKHIRKLGILLKI
jgi:intein/homing endonuclease